MLRRHKRSARPASRPTARRPRFEALEARELMAAFSVTTVADSGVGSLRAAIVAANADTSSGADAINFAIPGGGLQTIFPASSLPPITRSVFIDGYSQGKLPAGSPPRVVIDGSMAGAGSNGLSLTGGSGSTIRGLSIVDFTPGTAGGGRGILALDGGGDSFVGDYLGVLPNGTTAGPNGTGIGIGSANNTVGGTSATLGNLISSNTGDGILINGAGATGNLVVGNKVGTDISGQFGVVDSGGHPVVGLHGINLSGPGNTVGGTVAGAGNVVDANVGPDGNSGIGILFGGTSTGNLVEGNRIGKADDGTGSGNTYGIYFGTPGATGETIAQDTVGGTAAGAGNMLAGNFIGITGNVTASLIAGNRIGTNSAGNSAGSGGLGVFTEANGIGIDLSATGSTIGGTAAGAGNVVSGNGGVGGVAGTVIPGTSLINGTGIFLSGGSIVVQGNHIGTNLAGTAALGNGGPGLVLQVTTSTIGGTAAGAGNVIAANGGDGITLDSNVGNVVQGNFIGVLPNGTAAGNTGNGVDIVLAAPTTPPTTALALNDSIGGTTFGSGNYLYDNSLAGIAVNNQYGAVTGLAFRSNSITGNGRLGIDLFSTGVPSTGYLFLNSATPTSSGGTLTGVFTGTPGSKFQLDFFANPAADASGAGQGRLYLGTLSVTPGPGGFAPFTFVSTVPTAGYSSYAATSTDPTGNTSEFSTAFPTTASTASTDLVVTGSVSSSSVLVGGVVVFTETITNAGTSPANGVIFTDALPASLVNTVTTTTAGTSAVSGVNVVTADVGTIAPGQSVTVKIAANPTAVAAIQNFAGAIGTTVDPNLGNNQATQTFVVSPTTPIASDLDIAVTPDSSTPKVGSNLTYDVDVANIGPSTATNVRVNDFLPANATLVSVTPTQGGTPSINGTLVTENLGTLAPGAGARIVIVLAPTAAGSLSNAANVSGNQFDPVASNNSAGSTLTVPVPSNAVLALTQAASPTPGLVGAPLTFTLTVKNSGTDPAPGVVLVDNLPAGSTFVSATPSQGSPATVANGQLTANLGTIAPGGSATLTLVVKPTTTGTLTNFAGVVASGIPGAGGVFASGTAQVAAGPGVVGLLRSGGFNQLVVNFNSPINASSAANTANYRLYAIGTTPRALTAKDKPITINSAAYISQTNGVVLTPATPLDPTQYYVLVVVGSTTGGITDVNGRKLVGSSGVAGSDFTTTFLASSLTGV